MWYVKISFIDEFFPSKKIFFEWNSCYYGISSFTSFSRIGWPRHPVHWRRRSSSSTFSATKTKTKVIIVCIFYIEHLFIKIFFRSTSGSDSSLASQPITGTLSFSHVGNSIPGYDSAVGSSATLSSPPRNLTPSSSSAGDGGLFSSPPSWASTPPMSPTSPLEHHLDYDQFHSTTARMSVPVKTIQKQSSKEAPILQKVTITSTGEIQQKKLETFKREISYQKQTSITQKPVSKIIELPKSYSASSVPLPTSSPGQGQRRIDFTGSSSQTKHVERESKYTTSISSIGGAVLRSKTADFERLLHSSKTVSKSPMTKTEPPPPSPSPIDDKKKYNKRRYTDSRHQTRHIPDAETIESASRNVDSNASTTTRISQVYKRRELISSVQTKQKWYNSNIL